MEPPIHTEYFLSGGAIILIIIASGANALISDCTRSVNPLYIVLPPEVTMFPYKSFLISTSHFMIDVKVNLWIPSCSKPMNDGLNKVSVTLNRSAPMVIT
eukprot:229394_1